jgi:hypothetical protein
MDNQNPEAPELLVFDPYATIVYNANPSFYGDVMPTKVDAAAITSQYRNANIWRERSTKNETNINKVRDYLIENYDEVGEEHAKEIAELLGIDLSTTLEVEFAVTIKATIAVPVGTTAYDLSTYDFDVELSTNEREYDIEDFDADIESIS